MKTVRNHLFVNNFEYCKIIFILFIEKSLFLSTNLFIMASINALARMEFMNSLIYAIINLAVWLIFQGFNIYTTNLKAKIIANANNRLRDSLISNLQHSSYANFQTVNISYYLSWMNNDIQIIESTAFDSYFKLIEAYLSIIISFIFLYTINIYLALATIAFFFIMYYFPRIFEKKISSSISTVSKGSEQFINKLRDNLYGFDVWYSYNKRDKMAKELSQTGNIYEQIKRKNKFVLVICENIIDSMSVLTQFMNNLFCIILVINGHLEVGAILSTGNLSSQFQNNLSNISQLKMKIKSVDDLFSKFSSITPINNTHEALQFENSIVLKNISFSYDGKVNILDHLNLEFKKYGKYALLGKSGVGKTTILKLLSGKIDNFKGEYFIDNQKICPNQVISLMNKIAYVDQNTYIFNNTFKYNITLGEDIDNETIFQICNQCQLSELIQSVADLNNIITENGSNLSGGQKQRIAIARALITKKEIILFDEGTSALDKENTDKINNLLLNNKNYTIIMVNHHLNEDDKNKFTACIQL